MDKNLQKLSEDPSRLFSIIGKWLKLFWLAICIIIMVIGSYKSIRSGEYGFPILCLIILYPIYRTVRNIIKTRD